MNLLKLKCNDDKVREFQVPWNNTFGEIQEAFCMECGKEFGEIYTTKVLKPLFKEHVCNTHESD